jgi:hypothetical protein
MPATLAFRVITAATRSAAIPLRLLELTRTGGTCVLSLLGHKVISHFLHVAARRTGTSKKEGDSGGPSVRYEFSVALRLGTSHPCYEPTQSPKTEQHEQQCSSHDQVYRTTKSADSERHVPE